MKLIYCIAALSFAANLHAQQASVDGRLFSSPSQRANLDESRKRLIQGLDIPEEVNETVLEDAEKNNNASSLEQLLLPRAKYNGVVIRQNGQKEYWVNGKSANSKSNIGKELRVKTHLHGKKITIDLMEDQRVHLQPGQVFSFNRDRKFEGYEDPHTAKGVEQPSTQKDIQETVAPQSETAENKQVSPTDVFDESFLINEIQKIELLEQRLKDLEGDLPLQ